MHFAAFSGIFVTYLWLAFISIFVYNDQFLSFTNTTCFIGSTHLLTSTEMLSDDVQELVWMVFQPAGRLGILFQFIYINIEYLSISFLKSSVNAGCHILLLLHLDCQVQDHDQDNGPDQGHGQAHGHQFTTRSQPFKRHSHFCSKYHTENMYRIYHTWAKGRLSRGNIISHCIYTKHWIHQNTSFYWPILVSTI